MKGSTRNYKKMECTWEVEVDGKLPCRNTNKNIHEKFSPWKDVAASGVPQESVLFPSMLLICKGYASWIEQLHEYICR